MGEANNGSIFSYLFGYCGVHGAFCNVPLQNFSQFWMSNAPTSVDKVWGGIWIAVVNEVWKRKNRVIFKEGVVDVL